jgi:hypothetical protein
MSRGHVVESGRSHIEAQLAIREAALFGAVGAGRSAVQRQPQQELLQNNNNLSSSSSGLSSSSTSGLSSSELETTSNGYNRDRSAQADNGANSSSDASEFIALTQLSDSSRTRA